MTDEPGKPIEQATPPTEPAAADSGAGQAESAPSSAPAGAADAPIEAGAATEAPAATRPELPVDQTQEAESPEEPVEAAPEMPTEGAAAQPAVDSEPAQTAPQAEAEAEETPAAEQAGATPAEAAPEMPTEGAAAQPAVDSKAAQPGPEAEAEAKETPSAEQAGATPAEAAPEAASAESSSEGPAEQQESAQAEEEEEKSDQMDWYILKVQSNREDSIREGLLRRVAIAGLGRYFGEVIVPMEQVTEFKAGKKRVTKRKLYPGYLVVQMEINDDTWFLVRETPGIGDFTGAAGHPTPMQPHEVTRIVAKHEEKGEEAPKLKIAFRPGDRVKINEGTFENFEGEVDTIDETNGRVTVMINIFGRSTPVELEYWQIESV